MWTSRWTKSSDELARLLAHWRGARAEVWEYSCGHGQLVIRIFREGPNPMHSLYLLCKDCRSVQFHSSWPEMDVRVDWKSGDDTPRHTVSDGNRLRVDCGGLFAVESDTFIHLGDQPKA